MLARWLNLLLGNGWQTSVCAWVCFSSGFVAASPELFGHWPALLALSKYIAIGSGAAGLRAAMDAKQALKSEAVPPCSPKN